MPVSRDLIPAPLLELVDQANSLGQHTRFTSEGQPILTLDSSSLSGAQGYLNRISRASWVQLGAECHNTSLALDSVAATQSEKGGGVPRILETIQKRAARTVDRIGTPQQGINASSSAGRSVLWDLYYLFRDGHATAADTTTATMEGGQSLKDKAGRNRTFHSRLPWQLQFLKSGCPEVFVLAFADLYREYGTRRGLDRDLSKDLIESVDYELCITTIGHGRRAVQALVQTLIASRRYVKESSGTAGQGEANGLGLRFLGTEESEMTGVIEEKATQELVKTLGEACTALEVFLESPPGRSLPKLQALFQHELAADTKGRSKTGLGERGIKRPGIGGMVPSVDSMDGASAVKKRLKVSGELAGAGSSPITGTGSVTSAPGSVVNSPSFSAASTPMSGTMQGKALGISAAGQRSPHPLMASSIAEEKVHSEDQSLALSFKSSSQFFYNAQNGYPSSTPAPMNPPTSILSSSSTQQAKTSNPLWSPVLGLNYLPQWPTKYATQVAGEIERWMVLMGHMEGAVFSERLVGLIKAVYPSDQKFLLDQILIEYMTWEGTDGRGREAEVDDTIEQMSSIAIRERVVDTTSSSPGRVKTGEWVVETIMSALVSLVIKPEESSSYLEPGSKKWMEPIELEEHGSGADAGGAATALSATPMSGGVPATSAFGGSAAARANAKKRRVRNLYNRRVSPFYATLAMFQPKRVVSRVAGMIYVGADEKVEGFLSNSKQVPDVSKPGLEGMDAHEASLRLAMEMGGGIEPTLKSDSPPMSFKQSKKMRKMMKKHDRRDIDDPEFGESRNMNKFPLHVNARDKKRRDRQGRSRSETRSSYPQSVREESLAPEPMDIVEPIAEHGQKGASAQESGPGQPHDQNQAEDQSQGHSQSQDQDPDQTHDQDREIVAEKDIQPSWMDETTDEQAFQLAKAAEANRMVCHAPFRVLMLVLQCLTRMNQAGALDAWITDAITGTIGALQARYLEWLVLGLLPAPSSSLKDTQKRIPNSLPVKSDASPTETTMTTTTLIPLATDPEQEESLRLLGVLMVAPGIGQDLVRTAMTAVENSWRGSIPADESTPWMRLKKLLVNPVAAT